MKLIIKRHLISAAITFLGTFLVVFCSAVLVEGFTFSTVALQSVLISAIIAGVRASLKVIWEIGTYLLTKKIK